MNCTHSVTMEEEVMLSFSLELTGNSLSKTNEKKSYSESNSEHRSDLVALNHSNQMQLCAKVVELQWVIVLSAAVQVYP